MAPFFYAAYALVVLLVSAAVGAVPGGFVRLLLPFSRASLALAATPIALVWWIWAGWLDSPYGISRFGLVVFAAISAVGFVCGWIGGVDAVQRSAIPSPLPLALLAERSSHPFSRRPARRHR